MLVAFIKSIPPALRALFIGMAIIVSAQQGIIWKVLARGDEKDDKNYVEIKVVNRKMDSLNAVHNAMIIAIIKECEKEKLIVIADANRQVLNTVIAQRDELKKIQDELYRVLPSRRAIVNRNSINIQSLKN